MTRIAIRGFLGHSRIFEDFLDAEQSDLGTRFENYAEVLGPHHMIEIEFLDESDINQRFFRFGTDPTRMALPLALADAERSTEPGTGRCEWVLRDEHD